MTNKLRFFLWCCVRRLLCPTCLCCPSCGGTASEVVDRKHLVLGLARCGSCLLLYRQPTTPPKESRRFYQDDYTQGYTTDMPDGETLRGLKERKFAGTERDYSRFIGMFDALGIGRQARVLEFGSSWGYGAWQLAQAGFDVQAYEVSAPRCRYARENLGVNAVDSLDDIEGRFDLIFSSHVLEHVDVLSQSLSSLEGRLASGGIMVHVTPNGSSAYREAARANWHLLWGEVHPQLLDEQFCLRRFEGDDLILGATPDDPDGLRHWDRRGTRLLDLAGPELFMAVSPKTRTHQG